MTARVDTEILSEIFKTFIFLKKLMKTYLAYMEMGIVFAQFIFAYKIWRIKHDKNNKHEMLIEKKIDRINRISKIINVLFLGVFLILLLSGVLK